MRRLLCGSVPVDYLVVVPAECLGHCWRVDVTNDVHLSLTVVHIIRLVPQTYL